MLVILRLQAEESLFLRDPSLRCSETKSSIPTGHSGQPVIPGEQRETWNPSRETRSCCLSFLDSRLRGNDGQGDLLGFCPFAECSALWMTQDDRPAKFTLP